MKALKLMSVFYYKCSQMKLEAATKWSWKEQRGAFHTFKTMPK
jgi:hypothetical protein